MPNPELATPTLWLPDRSESYVIFGFTGQGQQSSDMFIEWYGYSPETDEILDHFHFVTATKYGAPLNPDDLEKGPLMQPANITLEMLGCTALENAGIIPNEVLGHSLGELGAVACAGCIEKKEVITLAHERGKATAMNIEELMNNGVLTGMAAISKKAGGAAEEVLATMKDLGINQRETDISNINADDQVVVAGLERHIEMIQGSLGKGTRLVKLAVDGAYHSLHMMLAKRELQAYVNQLAIKKPTYPKVYSSTTAKELRTRDQVSDMILGQLVSKVRYEQLIRARLEYLNQSKIAKMLHRGGANEVVFVEIGPYPDGKPNDQGVLIGLNRKNVAKYQYGSMPIRQYRVSRPKDLQFVA